MISAFPQYRKRPTTTRAGVGRSVRGMRSRSNRIRVKTSTGIRDVSYNILNRPTSFVRTNADGTQTKITAAYDTHGRRVWKKVEEISADGTTATVTSHRLFLYRGYLQIASLDLTRPTLPAEHFILWDPTQSVATRPLGIRKDGTWYTYGWDLTKNICEVFSSGGTILTAYTYTPYGAVTATGNVTQPIQWSSEYNDSELSLIYFNYRYYDPLDGRWVNFDPIGIHDDINLYSYVKNAVALHIDELGLDCNKCNEYLSKKMQTYAIAIANIRRKCKLDIICEEMERGTDGYVIRLDNRRNPFSSVHIYLAIGCCTGATEAQSSEEDSFGHELVHAQDHCNNDDPDTGCAASVCSELRAYTIGGCKGKVGTALKACLIDRVPASSSRFCGNNKDLVKQMIEKNYDECLRGYPH